ncbi:sulfate adenylyltransferase [Candidatus Pacearchaeota archaeon]|nr:sulfate adenylyltransferase [Candidatus Pacearchaeota archaeon]
MVKNNNVKVIVTLGPATNKEDDISKIKDKGADFVRINMSHSSTDDLNYFIKLSKEAEIPFIIDTEGSQIRTGDLNQNKITYEEGNVLKIYSKELVGDSEKICLKPGIILKQLKEGDLILVDFNTLVLKVSDISTIGEGYISARVVTQGYLGNNKSAVIVSAVEREFKLPVLTEKDKKSIEIGLKEGISHIAISYVKGGKDVDEAKKATNNAMYIISKVESKESLINIDEILDKSDAILLDRGDMSKEVPVEKIPIIQKIILKKAKEKGKQVFVATNLLESMIENKKPTRAEVNDVITSIIDGADGLILSAETAIGKYPMACINMMNKLIKHSKLIKDIDHVDYLSTFETTSLIEPHGGKLIERFIDAPPDNVDKLVKIKLSEEQGMDVEQIAIGTFSPIEGFMGEKDFNCVLDNMRLNNGVAWPIPIVLDISEKDAENISVGEDITLINTNDEVIAILHVGDKYQYDKKETADKLYCTDDEKHPGVKMLMNMKPILIGGKIDLIKRKDSDYKEYELTPRQVRRLFDDRGWVKVVGFHTRNVIHRGHEFIQLSAMKKENCDGLFVHPIIGKKKSGDYNSKYIIETYEKMMKDIYPKNSVVMATFSTFSRYAGPREAIFTALCRKNFGCSHFIVGRDHTGVSNYYHPNASHQIFNKFPDLGIKPIIFDKVFYSNKLKKHVHEKDVEGEADLEPLHISGTQARKMFEDGKMPPEWFMRPEISKIIMDSIKKGEQVFVK